MSHRPALALLLMAMLISACGVEPTTGEIASLEDPTDAAPAFTEPADDELTMEEGLIAFTECLREQGLEVGDPTVDADGNLQMPPIEMSIEASDEAGTEVFEREINDKFAACESVLPQMAFTGNNLPEVSEMEDLLVEYAGCMRDNGVDMPDPDFSGGGGMIDLGISDPTDSTFQAADEACRSILAGFGPMGG